MKLHEWNIYNKSIERNLLHVCLVNVLTSCKNVIPAIIGEITGFRES